MHLEIIVYINMGRTEHLSLSPELGTVPNRAFREGVHLEGVRLEGFLCSTNIFAI